MTLAEEIKNRTHYQDLYFVVFFSFSSLKRKSNKNTIGFQAFTLAFISMVIHEGTSVFPLGIFSIKSFILSSKRSQCQGRWFARVSMQLRAWLKRLTMCLELVLQTWRRRYIHSALEVHRLGRHSRLYSCSLWYLLVSQTPSQIPHIFQVHSSKFKKNLESHTNFQISKIFTASYNPAKAILMLLWKINQMYMNDNCYLIYELPGCF